MVNFFIALFYVYGILAVQSNACKTGFVPNEDVTPVVIWHGMNQNGDTSPVIARTKAIIEETTGAYVWSIIIGNSIIEDVVNSFFMPVNKQVQMVCDQISSNPKLQNGFHAIGFSQGGQFLRAVAQRCPYPPMKNLITIASQHQGVFGFPDCSGETNELCDIVREKLSKGAYKDDVQEKIVQAQYWHDPKDHETYVEKSLFIADINNEKTINNVYKENLIKLEHFVMVKNLQDTTVEPNESAHFEFYRPGSDTEILPLRESAIYTEDRIGLKTLDESDRLIRLSIGGGHLDYETQWFIDNIVNVYLQ